MTSPTHLFGRVHDDIRKAERILLVSDGKADGDSIGSTTAVLNWLLREGKIVEAFSIEAVPSSLRFLDQVHRITSDPAVFDQPFDLVLTFDASDPKRCGITDHHPRIPTKPPIVVFDHHQTNPRYGDTNFVLTDACSTCEVVYQFFITNGVHIDDRMATSLLTGITTDTSSFTNQGTTQNGMEAAAHLIRSGARHTDIVAHVIRNKSTEGLKLWGLALARLRINPEHDIASTYFLLGDFKNPNDEELADGLSNFLGAVCTDTDVTLVLREIPDGFVRGSLRSRTRDISKLAQQYGGGGHKKAAGFTAKGTIEEVLALAISEC